MKQYYAIITPGICCDMGELILVDEKLTTFIAQCIKYDNKKDKTLERFKTAFDIEQWNAFKKDLREENLTDVDFFLNIKQKFSIQTEYIYYEFKNAKSTLSFKTVTKLFQYIKNNDGEMEIIGDF